MRSDDIRRRFLTYFEQRGHTIQPSASLILDDPNLLFVGAGMVQFKPYLLGQVTPPYQRATTIQKCLRAEDLDEVGKTNRHNTFFQMAGNFSFGDYFKEQAIAYAWELITTSQDDGGFGFDPNTIWATVYHDDDEAVQLWQKVAGLPEERIQRRGMKDNLWSMGIPGPCGPSSEIYVDRGPAHGPDGGPVVDEERFLEIWNLVFMDSERGPGGVKEDYPILGPLPAKNIDTGMGMERVAFLLQDADHVCATDLFASTIRLTEEVTGRRYGADRADDTRMRVIADHARAATMAIADGVIPSNEGRGYVLRRLLRRVIYTIRLLGYDEPVMRRLVGTVRDNMGPSYPELISDFDRIAGFAQAEEDAFRHTIRQGTTIFTDAVSQAKSRGERTLPGGEAFTLHDTYGFPIDLTLEMAADQGLSVDEAEFRRLMAEQRQRAKEDADRRKAGHADTSAYRAVLDQHGETTFTGYTEAAGDARIVALLRDGAGVPVARAGEDVELVLDATPFYAESGGQQADVGTLRTPNGELTVRDVQRPVAGLIVHNCHVVNGEVALDDRAVAEIDVPRRLAVSRAHTATHLIHRAVRGALGDAARQAGSLNSPGRLRFDFTAPGAVSAALASDVEAEVNAKLTEDLPVQSFITNLDEAKRLGALAFFGEKYGDEVRVVEIGGEYSRELCGGTHAPHASQLGLVKLVSDASIGAGVRRVEALVGTDAFDFLAREHALVAQLAESVKAPREQLVDRVQDLVERLRSAEKELATLRAQQALAGAGQLAAGARDVNGVRFVGAVAPEGVAAGELRTLATDVRGRLDASAPGVVVLIGVAAGKVSFVAATNDAARSRGIAAGALVRALAPAVDGRGGGKDDMAQGGGSNPAGAQAALQAAENQLRQ